MSKAILGLVAILVLAYVGGHPRVQQVERRLRISQVVTAGFPFVILGLIARLPGVGVLSDPIFTAIRPILPLGLGWIGFAIGFRFDVRGLDALPRGVTSAVALTTLLPLGAIVGGCGLLLMLADQPATTGGTFLRDAMILGTAGAMTARTVPGLLTQRGVDPGNVTRVARIVQFEELFAVLGIGLLSAFFRPQGAVVAWQMPGLAWVFVILGMGTAIGGLVFAVLANHVSKSEINLILLGSICFTAGMASFLRLSPIAVCFVAGLLLANFPGSWKSQVQEAIARLERSVHLVFLVIAGALWGFRDWQGWVLMVLFVVGRMAGKWLGIVAFCQQYPGTLSAEERRSLSVAPLGALAVAIVVNAQDLYFGPTVPWLVTAVIGGAIVTEVIVQTLDRGTVDSGRVR